MRTIQERLSQRIQRRLEALLAASGSDGIPSLDEAVTAVLGTIQFYVSTLAKGEAQPAVLSRPILVERWPMDISIGAIVIQDTSYTWPEEISQEEVQAALQNNPNPDSFDPRAAAIVLVTQQRVLADLKRHAIALDAGLPHHVLISGLRDTPKDGMRHSAGCFTGLPIVVHAEKPRVQIIVPRELDPHQQRSIQFELPLDGIQEEFINTLRGLLGPMSLRHWAAMQHALTIRAGRIGRYMWSLQEHLRVLGYSERAQRDPRVQDETIRTVSAFTLLEIVVKQQPKEIRGPVFARILEGRQIQEGRSILEGMVLELHPVLYAGVRNPTTGELGSNWYPQAPGIAQIDHTKRCHAIALGLILPIRWRWAWVEGRDYVTLSGANLLRAAGISFNRQRQNRVWKRLEENLDELQSVNGLGAYEWEACPWTLGGVCKLYPPQWAIDRTIHRLTPPRESMPKLLPQTGLDLVTWRNERGLSQAEFAKVLGVHVNTVKLAEKNLHKSLGKAISKSMLRIDDSHLLALPPSKM